MGLTQGGTIMSEERIILSNYTEKQIRKIISFSNLMVDPIEEIKQGKISIRSICHRLNELDSGVGTKVANLIGCDMSQYEKYEGNVLSDNIVFSYNNPNATTGNTEKVEPAKTEEKPNQPVTDHPQSDNKDVKHNKQQPQSKPIDKVKNSMINPLNFVKNLMSNPETTTPKIVAVPPKEKKDKVTEHVTTTPSIASVPLNEKKDKVTEQVTTNNTAESNSDENLMSSYKKINDIIQKYPGLHTNLIKSESGLYHGIIYNESNIPIRGYTIDVSGCIINRKLKWWPVEIPDYEKGKGYEDYPCYSINNEAAWKAFIEGADMSKMIMINKPSYLSLNKWVDMRSLPSVDNDLRMKIIEKVEKAFVNKQFAKPSIRTANRYRFESVNKDGTFTLINNAPYRFTFQVKNEPEIRLVFDRNGNIDVK